MRPKKKNLAIPFVLSLVGAGSGCRVCSRRQGHALLVHSFGLRAHDEAEEVLVGYGGPSGGWWGRGTALVIQTGTLAGLETGTTLQFQISITTSCMFCHCTKQQQPLSSHTIFGRIGYLTLDEHIEEVVVRLRTVRVGHQVAEHGLVAVLVESEARQASPCC